jgi:hypothetical protein
VQSHRGSRRVKQSKGSGSRAQRQQAKGRGGVNRRLGKQSATTQSVYGDYYSDYGAAATVVYRRTKKNKKNRRRHGPNETSEEMYSNGGDYGNYNYGG